MLGYWKGHILEGRWKLGKKLGHGSMSEVYYAQEVNGEREAAIKILHMDITGYKDVQQRMLREAMVLSATQHAHIIKLLDFGYLTRTGSWFMAMEYLHGATLHDYQKNQRLSLLQILDLMEQMLSALDTIHHRKIVHRDLKPSNIFLKNTNDNKVHTVLFDFGIVHLASSDVSPLTLTGELCGTPYFMAPEQILEESIKPQTDYYALGIVLFWLLAGKVPFEGKPLEVFQAHCNQPPPQILDHWKLPEPPEPQFGSLVMSMLAKRPEDRPTDVKEISSIIEEIRLRYAIA